MAIIPIIMDSEPRELVIGEQRPDVPASLLRECRVWAEDFIATLQARLDKAAQQIEQQLQQLTDELRGARNRNADLQQQLARARASATKMVEQSREPGWFDWDTEKRRLITLLELSDDTGGQAERSRIEEVLRTTDDIVAAKNREIEELRSQLRERPCNTSESLPNQSASNNAMDTNAMILEERERLRSLQQQWRQKLLQAEVEIARQRADIARQQAKLSEQLQALMGATAKPPGASQKPADTESSARRRWLAQLGLTEEDLQTGRHL